MLKVPMKILHLGHLDVKNAKKKEQTGLHYGCVSVALCKKKTLNVSNKFYPFLAVDGRVSSKKTPTKTSFSDRPVSRRCSNVDSIEGIKRSTLILSNH